MITTKLFLASSSEFCEERKEFELCISRKNKALRPRGVVIEVVLWEDFLNAMSKTRLQDEYNQAIRECDLFVTLVGSKAGRYTDEEFETAHAQFKATGRPLIFTYFKDVQISSASVNRADMASLWAFEDKLKVVEHFPTRYTNTDQLKHEFNQQLDKLLASGSIRVASHQPEQSQKSPKVDAGPTAGRAYPVDGYLRWLRSHTESIELRGIERAGGALVVSLPLEAAYVPLRARPIPRPGDAQDKMAAQSLPRPRSRGDAGEKTEPDERERDSDIDLNQVLGLGNRLVIIGGPGSGKTTVLLHMAWALASSLLTGQAEPAQSRLGLAVVATSELPLPIFVPLASFARFRRELPANAPARERTLTHFISYHLIGKQADVDLPDDFFVQLLRDGRPVILLLDGLDEVANEEERAEVRASVEELVSGQERMRVVVTCRTIAYRSGGTALGVRFREIAVQPLDFEQHVVPMVRQAYACIHPQDADLRSERVQELLGGIRRLEDDRRTRLGDDAQVLVDSPLMVRLLLIVHVNNRTLPDGRAELFDKAISALLQVDYGREQADIRELASDWKVFRDMAQHLAFHMHQQGRDQGREIGERALQKVLREEAEFRPHIDRFLSHARQRGSVLEERQGAYRFIHLAFQEFLVARYLREVTGDEGRDAILAVLGDRLDDPWWREPILLLAGYRASNAAKSARDFLGALARVGGEPNAQFSAAELAGTAALGDPRFDQERFWLPADEMLGFVRIAADPEFRIGTRKVDVERVAKIVGREVDDREINDAPTPTPEYLIARYPVTVAQFRAFVEAAHYEVGDADALRDPDSRPVCLVSWHEAIAYCRWLHEQLAASRLIEGSDPGRLVRQHQWRVALPSELEWEKAARGGLLDAVFSWGNDVDPARANDDDSGVGDTSAVGSFSANDFGLHDMIGNVFEWTRSLYKPYSYHPDDGREDLQAADNVERVVRGGSWVDPRGSARCACRFRNVPVDRNYILGFRVVLRSSPVE
ncbi:MAG: SUMF1/EgtB/PvdO family nonheme iron enzyme [Rhodobacteraceae bacterium]|jgi:formylglycine-generating enzyme required for sulfatase activity|nr:SUMF1/EgtB/PvdO family nonheme iron enzyme [Paracoccaceae bacterium]